MSTSPMPPVYIDFLNRFDVEELHLTDEEIIGAIETQLRLQGEGKTTIQPRVFLEPGVARGHFNVLRGAIGADINRAGVKVVGDFVDNYQLGYPSELATLLLLDPAMGAPRAIIEASGITDMRTGAVTAVGAKYLARRGSKVLGHIGARGSSYWNVRLLDSLFHFDEIRVHSRRPDSRDAFAERLSRDLGKTVVATTDWQSALEGADIVVEASRLVAPEPLLKTRWIKPGALVMPYGTQSAVEDDLTDIMAKLVVDDWGQCANSKWGALRSHVESGKLSPATLHAEMGQIVAGLKPGRESEDERILFWHRGAVIVRHRLGPRHAGQGQAAGCGPAAAVLLSPSQGQQRRGCISGTRIRMRATSSIVIAATPAHPAAESRVPPTKPPAVARGAVRRPGSRTAIPAGHAPSGRNPPAVPIGRGGDSSQETAASRHLAPPPTGRT